ncbi:DUF4055 domain-containing protein [Candidatus Pacearchaeota archaeon]|nr:DUF4055 domain-containing protein [Candidatus Pacearchaeota archaeon]
MATEKATVATTSIAYNTMEPRWWKMGTLLSGTAAMRDAGEEMAPRHEHESVRNYDERIGGNVLFNMVDLTLRMWVGRPFANQIQYTEDFAAHLVPLMDDVDLDGNNLDVYSRRWFRDGVAKAFSHTLVEFPRVGPAIVGPRTLADDDRMNIRPYFVHVGPEQVIFALATRIDGKEVLTHVRISEEVITLDGWEQVVTEQIRVLELDYVDMGTDDEPDFIRKVRVDIHQQDEKKNWVVVETWHMDIDFIPLVTFYADRQGFMLGRSPLDDLADLNIRHWQSMSDQVSILTVARFPMLACSGGDDEESKLVIGPKEWLYTPDPAARFYYVEHKGAAIAAGEKDLEGLEKRMQSYGAEFTKDRPDRESASARELDSSEATSPLQDVTFRFNDALNVALEIMSVWMRQKHSGKAGVPTEFTSPQSDELLTIYNTWIEGGLTTEEYLKELQRRGVLSEENVDFKKPNRKPDTNVNEGNKDEV